MALHECPQETPAPGDALFICFAETSAAIAATSGKLEKVRLLADYLKLLPELHVAGAAVWFTDFPFAPTENKILQLGWALLRDSVCEISGLNEGEFHQVYLRHSDLGETAFDILKRHAVQKPRLTLSAVKELFEALLGARGPGAKLPFLTSALRQCTPLEAKFLVKIITSDLRIGLKEGLVEEAIAEAFNAPAEAVRQANLLLGHIGEMALLAKRDRLSSASLIPFRPVKFMLASPEETAADIWERMQPNLKLD